MDKSEETERPSITKIAAVRASHQSVYQALSRGIDLVGPINLQQDSIAIKINLCAARTPETGAITDPIVLDALLRYLREKHKDLKISVVESDATAARPDFLKDWFGFSAILRKYNVEWCNLSKAESVVKEVKGRFLKEISVPRILEDSFFITLPKPKAHILTDITCCLKNQFGCIPKVRKIIYHKYLDDVIVDANVAMRPDLCIVDGIVAMGGNLGPGVGVPIPLNAIICGNDPVAVDAYCAKLMGLAPSCIGHIRKAARSGVGSMNYLLVGDEIPKIDFEISKLGTNLLRLASYLSKRSTVR
jgi:uncharacterized protein (DUF362 family)